MKNIATLSLLVTLFLLAGCSARETYFFHKPKGEFWTYQRPLKTETPAIQATAATSSEDGTQNAITPDSVLFLASAEPAALAPIIAQPKRQVATNSITLIEKSGNAEELASIEAGINKEQKEIKEKPQKGRKKAMPGKIEAGFALSLFGVISTALIFISPYFLFFSGLLGFTGLVLSSVGLLQVQKGKDKFRGRVRALAGIILGVISTALAVYLLYNNL